MMLLLLFFCCSAATLVTSEISRGLVGSRISAEDPLIGIEVLNEESPLFEAERPGKADKESNDLLQDIGR